MQRQTFFIYHSSERPTHRVLSTVLTQGTKGQLSTVYVTRYDNLDRGVLSLFSLGITRINAENSPVHVTVLLSDLNTFYQRKKT